MFDENPLETYSYLLKQLDKKGIAFVELVEPDSPDSLVPVPKNDWIAPEKQIPEVTKALSPYFKGTIIINNGLTPETAEKAINSGIAHLASFGKNFINNPDLVERIRNGWEVDKTFDFATAFANGPEGYIDFPFSSDKSAILASEGN